MLKPERFAQLAASHIFVSLIETKIKKCSKQEAEVIQGLVILKSMGPCKLKSGLVEGEEAGGLVYHQGRLYVPDDPDLRAKVISTYHDALTAGHPGCTGTLELVSRHYWWPGM
jgi:hypothetical protein